MRHRSFWADTPYLVVVGAAFALTAVIFATCLHFDPIGQLAAISYEADNAD